MVYAMICPYNQCDINDTYIIVKIIKNFKNGKYIISYPKINYINEYLEEYDFTNIELVHIATHNLLNTVVSLPDDFNEMIKFTLPVLVRYLGLNTTYDFTNKKPKMVINIDSYIDFEKINSEMFLLNLKLYTEKYFKLIVYINKHCDVNNIINYKYKIRNIHKKLVNFEKEIWIYLKQQFSNVYFNMNIDYKFCHVFSNL